jgi:NAD(P)-dependent dehydrogenase (short-subunit alcohol dehydrogenase family)
MRWNDLVDAAVELPIAPSFTRLGHDIRSRTDHWQPVGTDMAGRVVVVTGATSGLGRSATITLAELGATVVLVGRDAARTEAACAEIRGRTGNDQLEFAVADMGDLRAVEALATELARRHDRIDVLIHNAGALTADRRESPQGIEMTVASQVMGPFLLTARLLAQLRVGGPGRVLTMSSGGMYSAASTVERLQMGADYKGAEQYARAKRAQVTLNEMWAQRVDPADVVFHALHPGWADTPGVAESLPTFRKIVGPLLRSPEQGADTLVWLACADGATASSGQFWLDRRVRSIHRLPPTRRSDTPQRRQRLWDECARCCGLTADELPSAPS